MNQLHHTVSFDSILADTPDGEPVRIDFEQLIGEHTLVAAMTGFGKSVLLRKAEELGLAVAFPMIILDSDGDSASLREAAPNGILVAGGEHGDPDVTIKETIRRLPQIVEARASVVLDIHSLDSADQDSAVAQVLTMMMRLPRNLQQPYLVVVDEVQRIAARREQGGERHHQGRQGRPEARHHPAGRNAAHRRRIEGTDFADQEPPVWPFLRPGRPQADRRRDRDQPARGDYALGVREG